MPRNFAVIFYGPEGTSWALEAPRGSPEEGALVGCAHLGCPRTASLLYEDPNIPKTVGESTKY